MRPGFLSNPGVIEWLEGVAPAWEMLAYESWCRLQSHPGLQDCGFTLSDSFASPLARNGMVLLEAAANGETLTANRGNLKRAFVTRMMNDLEWPGFDREMHEALHKVTNEPEFLPLHALRIFCQQAGLLRKNRGTLRLTKTGRTLFDSGEAGRLHRALFEAAFWNTNLSYFDGYALEVWPQSSMGLILWCLSVLPNQAEDVHRLARLCTIPVNGILDDRRELAGHMFHARILRPLHWFGLVDLELRPHPDHERIKERWFAPSDSLSRFIRFDVDIDAPSAAMH
jgi:hypothetical protein